MTTPTNGAVHLWSILRDKIGMLAPDSGIGEAVHLAERLLELARRSFPENDPAIAESLEILGNLYADGGRTDEAADLLREACDMRLATGGNAGALLRAGAALGSIFLSTTQNEEAAEIYGEILPVADREMTEDPISLAQLHLSYAIALNRLQSDDPAEAHYRRALEIFRDSDRSDDALLATLCDHLGEFFLSRERLKAAEEFYSLSLQIRRRNDDIDPTLLARAYFNLAVVHHSAAQPEEAEALYADALEILDSRGGGISAEEAAMLENYATLLRAEGKSRQAGQVESRIRRAG